MASTDVIHWENETQLLGHGESDTTGCWIKFRVLPEDLDKFRGLKSERFYVVVVRMGDDEKPVPPVPAPSDLSDTTSYMVGQPKVAVLNEEWVAKVHSEKPYYGKEASELYKHNFFFNPHVMAKVGTPEEYAAWVQRQPSAYSGKFNEYVHGEGRCVAAHVRRVADGAGAGIKNDYAVIPLTHDEHANMQHQHGESELGGKTWFDHQRARHLSRWMAQTLFQNDSMGHVAPRDVNVWAKANSVDQYLPEAYR